MWFRTDLSVREQKMKAASFLSEERPTMGAKSCRPSLIGYLCWPGWGVEKKDPICKWLIYKQKASQTPPKVFNWLSKDLTALWQNRQVPSVSMMLTHTVITTKHSIVALAQNDVQEPTCYWHKNASCYLDSSRSNRLSCQCHGSVAFLDIFLLQPSMHLQFKSFMIFSCYSGTCYLVSKKIHLCYLG